MVSMTSDGMVSLARSLGGQNTTRLRATDEILANRIASVLSAARGGVGISLKSYVCEYTSRRVSASTGHVTGAPPAGSKIASW